MISVQTQIPEHSYLSSGVFDSFLCSIIFISILPDTFFPWVRLINELKSPYLPRSDN